MASFIKAKLKLARDAISKKDFQAAADASNQVLGYEPDNYNAHVFLGLSQLELGQYDQSEEAFHKATSLAPDQVLAWQGLSKLYERVSNWPKFAEVLERLMAIFSKGQDATKCAETLQKLIDLRRKYCSPLEVASTLSLLLPGSPMYDVLSALPPPDPTAPTATTTFAIQVAIYDTLPVLLEILSIRESEEEASFKRELEKRRMRLGASPLPVLTQEVGLELWSASPVPELYKEIINHVNTSDELRRSTEAKHLSYKWKFLCSIPHPSAKHSKLKADLRKEVQEMVDGMILLGIPNEIAWSIWIEGQDICELEQYDVKTLQKFLGLLPNHTLSGLVKGFFAYMGYKMKDEDEKGEDAESNGDISQEEDYYPTILDGLSDNQNSIFAHHIAAQLYLDDQDYENTIKVAQSGLELVSRSEVDFGRPLLLVQKAFKVITATALVHLFPPKHHPRALALLDEALKEDPDNIKCLMGRAYVLQYSKRWPQARALFSRVVELNGVDDIQYGLEAKEEEIWCRINTGQHASAFGDMKDVIRVLDTLDEHAIQQARAWWRLGRCCWDIAEPESRRKESYEYFITSLKRLPTYAPSFTSLGVWYLEVSDPPDLIRASKCFQKAFELDSREADAARRLAEGFANEREWDLVEVVARRTIEGEGGIEGGKTGAESSAGRRFLPTNAWAWRALGVVELNKGRYAEAIQSFQITLRAEENDSQSWVRLGEAYAKSGRHVAALKALSKAKAIAPDDWGCRYITGEVFQQVGQYKQAISDFEAVLSVRPSETGVLISLAQAHLSMGREEMRTGFWGRSEISLVNCLALATKVIQDEYTKGFRGMAWKAVGDALYELSKSRLFNEPQVVATAVQPLASILADTSPAGDVSFSTSEPAEASFDVTSAVSDLLPKLKIGESDGHSAVLLCIAAYKRRLAIAGKDDQTVGAASFDVAVAMKKLATYGDGENAVSRPEHISTAVWYIKQALHHEPGNPEFWTALGTLFFQNNIKLAQHALIRAVEQDGKNAGTWCNLGLLYMYHEDLELANQAFYRAQTLNPDYALAWVGQAMVATVNGHATDARALLEHAVGLSADVPEADLEFATRVFAQLPANGKGAPPPTDVLFAPFAVLDRYCQQRPTDPSALNLFGLICERLGLLDLALDVTSRSITLLDAAYNQSEDATIERRYASANINLGRLRLANADFSGALEAFDTALSLLSTEDGEGNGEQEIYVLRAQAQMGSGIANYKLDDLTKALGIFEGAMEEIPAELVDVRGHICLSLSQTLWAIGSEEARDMAKSQLFESITENSKNMEAITALAAMGILNKDDDLLDAALSEILGMPFDERQMLDPSRMVDYLLVTHHLAAGGTDKALSMLSSSLHLDPSSPLIRQQLATILIRLKKHTAASSILGAIIDPQKTRDRSSLSETIRLYAIASKEGQAESDKEAISSAQKAVFLAPWETSAYISLDYCTCN